MKGVQQIVNLLAVDHPIAVVTRLITSFNKVESFRRGKEENLNRFVDRFRGLASDQLMHAGASSSSQIGEVLAITLLNNANLEEGILANANMQLTSLAEPRGNYPSINTLVVKTSTSSKPTSKHWSNHVAELKALSSDIGRYVIR